MVNTGDNLAHPKAVPAVVQALGDLLSRPGVFVFGSNDYFGPRLKNPMNYLTNPGHRVRGEPLPWQDLRAAFTERGWLDLTHTRREFEVAGLHIAAAGVDDPHIDRDRYDAIAGSRQPGGEPAAGADAFARAAGAGPLRRRRLPAGDGRPHPRRAAVPAVLRGPGDQLRPGPLPGQGPVTLGRRHAVACLRRDRHLAVRAGAVLLPARSDPADVDRHPDGRPRLQQQPGPFRSQQLRCVERPDPDRGPQPPALLDGQRDPADRGRRPSQRRHPLAAVPAAVGLGHGRRNRAVSQRRDDPHHRQPQTPVGALVVPVRAVQRVDRRGHHGGRGVVGFHGDIRGLLRVPARSAVHRRGARGYQSRPRWR